VFTSALTSRPAAAVVAAKYSLLLNTVSSDGELLPLAPAWMSHATRPVELFHSNSCSDTVEEEGAEGAVRAGGVARWQRSRASAELAAPAWQRQPGRTL